MFKTQFKLKPKVRLMVGFALNRLLAKGYKIYQIWANATSLTTSYGQDTQFPNLTEQRENLVNDW